MTAPTYPEFVASSEDPPTVIESSEGGSLVWAGTGDFFEPKEFGERDRVDLLNTRQAQAGDLRYRLRAIEAYSTEEAPRDVLEILPVVTEDVFLTLLYLPTLDLEVVEGDVFYQEGKGIAEEWLILDTLIVLRGKTDDQTALWERRKVEIQQQLLQQATDRDSAQSPGIRQVFQRPSGRRRTDARWPWRSR